MQLTFGVHTSAVVGSRINGGYHGRQVVRGHARNAKQLQLRERRGCAAIGPRYHRCGRIGQRLHLRHGVHVGCAFKINRIAQQTGLDCTVHASDADQAVLGLSRIGTVSHVV